MSSLELKLARLLENRRRQSRLRQLKSSPPSSTTVDFSSNDFLSLASTASFRRDFLSEQHRIDLPVGSTGSRLLDGNSSYAEQLERDIAVFHGAEAALLTNSGFDANVSIFMCLPQTGDVIVYDELIHASVHDGMRQSRATDHVSFQHNSVHDLQDILCGYTLVPSSTSIFVAVESVYSMDGDLAPLTEIADLIRRLFPLGNCHLIVDEAHATGVYGPHGRGRVSELGLEQRVLVRLHTFGKALACNGAVVLCSDIIKQYLLNYARPLIYTTFMSYSSLSAIKVAYVWLQQGRTEELVIHLFNLIRYLHAQLQTLKPSPWLPSPTKTEIEIPTSCPSSPIFALMTTHPRALAAHCQAKGFMVRAVVPPTVPEGTDRVRVCLHAGNTYKHIDEFVGCLRGWIIEREQEATTVGNNREDMSGSEGVHGGKESVGLSRGGSDRPSSHTVHTGIESSSDVSRGRGLMYTTVSASAPVLGHRSRPRSKL